MLYQRAAPGRHRDHGRAAGAARRLRDRAAPAATGRHAARSAGAITNTRRPTTSCARCAPRCWCWGRWWRGAGEARVSLPGGCAIGTRPVDLHLKGLERMGARDRPRRGLYRRRGAPGGCAGATIVFPFVSVGATENLLMAATPGRGRDRAGQRGARAGDRRPRRAASYAMGARDRGHRQRPLAHRGRQAAARRARTAIIPRPHRDRHLRLAAAITGGAVELRGAPAGPSRRGGARAAARPAWRSARTPTGC